MPGLGRIIGTKDYARATRLRDEINALIWLSATALGASILLWNRTFVGLWVGPMHYSGPIPNLLIVIGAMQLAFIRSDGNLIDLTLRMSRKVLLGMVSVTFSILAACLMVGYFKLGVVGLCVGIMAGRLILSIGYPTLIGRFLDFRLSSQLKGLLRGSIVTILLFSAAAIGENFIRAAALTGPKGWMLFILLAGTTGIMMLIASFYGGLPGDQRRNIIRRIRAAMATTEPS